VSVSQATVGVVGTGGTIQNTASGRISIATLLEEVVGEHGGRTLPSVIHDDIFTVASESFTPSDWVAIACRTQELATDPRVSGIVVTHGTYTAEETSYFLHLCVGTEKPIVVTCSQRLHGSLGNDGDRNLVDAIRVAASPQARALGCVLVAGEEIHSSREATKTSQRPGGFNSGLFGPIGTVETDTVSIYRMPTRRHTTRSEFAARSVTAPLPRVEIVETYPGAAVQPLTAALHDEAQGVVINGYTPRGLPTGEQSDLLARAAETRRIPIVVVGRGRWGRVPKTDEAVPWITGDNLSAYKARILLMLGIAAEVRGRDLQRLFDEY